MFIEIKSNNSILINFKIIRNSYYNNSIFIIKTNIIPNLNNSFQSIIVQKNLDDYSTRICIYILNIINLFSEDVNTNYYNTTSHGSSGSYYGNSFYWYDYLLPWRWYNFYNPVYNPVYDPVYDIDYEPEYEPDYDPDYEPEYNLEYDPDYDLDNNIY